MPKNAPVSQTRLTVRSARRALSYLTTPLNRRQSLCVGGSVFFIVATLFFAWVIVRFGLNGPPSSSSDESSYDSIGWELSRGGGYAIDYANAEFREPYDNAAQDDPKTFSMPKLTVGPVAFRPPLIPVVTAVGNRLFGRQHFFLRSVNILAMAAVGGIVAHYLCRNVSVFATLTMMFLFLTDVRSRLYARALLTEALACLLTTIITLLLLQFVRKNDIKTIAIVGLVFGLSILTRSIAVLWLPGLLAIVVFISRRTHNNGWLSVTKSAVLFSVCTLVPMLPWAVRNIAELDRFAPMGTQGLMQLSAGYSDIAVEHSGVWQNLESRGFFEHSNAAGLTGIEYELAAADYSKSKALQWIQSHPTQLPLLAVMKVVSEFRPHHTVPGIILTLSLFGLLTGLRNTEVRVISGMILVNAIVISLTWSVEGRFLVPQLFCFYVLAGYGVHSLSKGLFREPIGTIESESVE